MGISIRTPYHTKRGRLYMEDSKGRLSNPTPHQRRLYSRGRRGRKATHRRRR